MVCNAPESPDSDPVRANKCRREPGSRRLVHEWHEFIRKTRHRAADTNASDVRTAADTCHPAAFGNITINHRSPAAYFYQAFGGIIVFGKIALFVVGGTIAPIMDSGSKKPLRTQLIVERNHRRESGQLIQQVEQGLHEIIRL